MKQSNLPKNLLILLLAFLSTGAFYGGISLVLKPDGSLLKMPVELLTRSVFKSYLIPGIILLLTFGILPLFVVWGLVKKPVLKFPESLNLLSDYHFAWSFSVYIGVGQVVWINIQTYMLNQVDLIHTVYSGLGLLIICIALLPQTRVHYRK